MMTLTDARARLSEVVDRARVEREPVYLTRRDRPVAAVIGTERLAQLLAAEAELASGASRGDAALEETEVDRIAALDALAARVSATIPPGTPPLVDADAFYQTRRPRL